MPEIRKVVVSLDGYIKKIGPLGLQVVQSRIQSHQQYETPLVDETTIFGRDVDKENIIQMLLSEDANGDNITVVPIVGLGGLGKTTLAQMVYKDSRVEVSFPTRAWVCVSEEYDATRITKELLRELNISFVDSDNLFALQVKLQGSLTEKKFLVVLDDVWNSNYNQWDNLRSPFNGGSRGSKIIVTTRDQNVAKMMAKERSIHHLGFISEEDCLSLFKKHAFENRDGNETAELEEIGNKIVKKCGGLPLAVKTTAGILRSKTTPKEWEEISEEWAQMDNQDGPIPALRLSYIHLPSHLKRCFAYCAVFHKDYHFRKEEIIQLWQANDLLEFPGENKGIKNKGEKCFDELRMRLLFHQTTDHTFSMHDLVNDLARFVSGKYCLRLEDHLEGNARISGARHFSYHPGLFDTFHKFNLLRENKNIRTFLPLRMDQDSHPMDHLSNKFLEGTLPQFMSLRVLSLSYYDNIVKLPNSCSALKQLRFLNLSSTKIKELPDWICSFYNLQTLLLSKCRELEELPANVGKLINLCCLDIDETPLKKMPPQMGRLINLQVLTAFVIGKDSGSTIEELGKLPMLCGKLFLCGLENVSSGRDASMANMEGKEKLEKLILKWNGDANDSEVAREVLDNLLPPTSIKHLKIEGYCGTTFPNWLLSPSLSRLESLNLSSCEDCSSLPALGELRFLQSLEIVGMSGVSILAEDFYGDTSATKLFPSLKKLRIEKLQEWNEWHIPECEVFNSLEELRIIDCPKLIGELPQPLSSLQILEISGCDNLVRPNGGLNIFNVKSEKQLSSLCQLRISALKNLKELPLQVSQLTSLDKLRIDDCGSVSTLQVTRLPTSLKSLVYKRCCNLELESETWEGGRTLEHLRLYNCDSLKVMWLGSFPMLKYLTIEDCRSIEMLSLPAAPRIGNQTSSLQFLRISHCNALMSFPEGGLAAPSLRLMEIWRCKKLKSLPKQMGSLLSSLQSLDIGNCPEIDCFPEGGLPCSLQILRIRKCKKLMSSRKEWGLEKLPSLTHLSIGETDRVVSFPDEGWQLPDTLQLIWLSSFKNLEVLNYSGLRHLNLLQQLYIDSCPRLQSLPKEGLPKSLTTLKISECPSLKPRLEWEKGKDWTKIAHIPCLEWEKGKDWSKIAHIPCVVVDSELVP